MRVGDSVAADADEAVAPATRDADGADELVSVDEQAAATTTIVVRTAASRWDATIVSPAHQQMQNADLA